jgi:hypothetical protein
MYYYDAMNKKHYIKPDIKKISIDYITTLLMLSEAPLNNDPAKRAGVDNNKSSDPFASPFGDKPFK